MKIMSTNHVHERDKTMTKSATTTECCRDDYHILRHLFTEAMQSSITDKRWRIFATYSDPCRTMLTQYEHVESGDRIKCQSFGYEDGEYRKHIFTFDQDVDVNDDPPNAEDQRAGPVPG
jgi:hypothetical protein